MCNHWNLQQLYIYTWGSLRELALVKFPASSPCFCVRGSSVCVYVGGGGGRIGSSAGGGMRLPWPLNQSQPGEQMAPQELVHVGCQLKSQLPMCTDCWPLWQQGEERGQAASRELVLGGANLKAGSHLPAPATLDTETAGAGRSVCNL